ncbi:MAG: hypothetical protein Q7J79_00105 [Gemmatimonadales bacterium]|nr:hypothetical protein [Gemmatimonadales bacterium]
MEPRRPYRLLGLDPVRPAGEPRVRGHRADRLFLLVALGAIVLVIALFLTVIR